MEEKYEAAVIAIVFATVVALVVLQPWKGPEKPGPSPPGQGTISVTSTPSGATVYINGQNVGITPVSVNRKPGTYTVKTVYKGTTKTRPVTVAEGQTSNVSFSFEVGGEAFWYINFSEGTRAPRPSEQVRWAESQGIDAWDPADVSYGPCLEGNETGQKLGEAFGGAASAGRWDLPPDWDGTVCGHVGSANDIIIRGTESDCQTILSHFSGEANADWGYAKLIQNKAWASDTFRIPIE